MLRGLLALMLLLVAAFVFFIVVVIGVSATSRITDWISLAVAGMCWAVGCAVVATIWAGAYAISPGPTKYLSVFGMIGMVMLSLLSMWIHREREIARRLGAENNLRQIGLELQQMREVRPDEEPQFDPERLNPRNWRP